MKKYHLAKNRQIKYILLRALYKETGIGKEKPKLN